jgi:putative intracellular protease/amidase
VSDANASDYAGLVLPGGVANPRDLPAFCATIVEQFANLKV